MDLVVKFLLVAHFLFCIAIIALVLVQHGKGADLGSSFGAGNSGSLFGASGSSNFLSKSTAFCVVVFFCTSLALAYIQSRRVSMSDGSVVSRSIPVVNTTRGVENSAHQQKNTSQPIQIPS